MSVLVCIPTRDGNPHVDTVTAINKACRFHGDSRATITQNGHNVCVSRNHGVAQLLRGDDSHILFVDDDTTIPEEAISRLVEVVGRGVSTGCVPTLIKGCEGRPIITVADRLDPETNGYVWCREWFKGVRDTLACGGACLMIHRSVLSTMTFPWFTYSEFYEDGKYYWFSEDIGFCKRIYAEGRGPIKAHGGVRCGHKTTINVADFIQEAVEEVAAESELVGAAMATGVAITP